MKVKVNDIRALITRVMSGASESESVVTLGKTKVNVVTWVGMKMKVKVVMWIRMKVKVAVVIRVGMKAKVDQVEMKVKVVKWFGMKVKVHRYLLLLLTIPIFLPG